MPRIARPVAPGIPHHVTQRGNRREAVFFTEGDRAAYLACLAEHCRKQAVEVLSYCLMTNHVHLVLVPATADGLEKVFRPLHTHYAQRLNRQRGWSGHVWQGRFFSSPLDEVYFWAAMRYVESNPVRAGLVRRAEEFRWSSARAHCGLQQDPVLTVDGHWTETCRMVSDWAAWLAEPGRAEQIDVIRHHVTRGLPCGGDDFVREMESRLGRFVRPRSVGRPRKVSLQEGA
jgi:putative transposase